MLYKKGGFFTLLVVTSLCSVAAPPTPYNVRLSGGSTDGKYTISWDGGGLWHALYESYTPPGEPQGGWQLVDGEIGPNEETFSFPAGGGNPMAPGIYYYVVASSDGVSWSPFSPPTLAHVSAAHRLRVGFTYSDAWEVSKGGETAAKDVLEGYMDSIKAMWGGTVEVIYAGEKLVDNDLEGCPVAYQEYLGNTNRDIYLARQEMQADVILHFVREMDVDNIPPGSEKEVCGVASSRLLEGGFVGDSNGFDLRGRFDSFYAVIADGTNCDSKDTKLIAAHELGHIHGLGHEGAGGVTNYANAINHRVQLPPNTILDYSTLMRSGVTPNGTGYYEQLSQPDKHGGDATTDNVRALEVTGRSVGKYFPGQLYIPPSGSYTDGCQTPCQGASCGGTVPGPGVYITDTNGYWDPSIPRNCSEIFVNGYYGYGICHAEAGYVEYWTVAWSHDECAPSYALAHSNDRGTTWTDPSFGAIPFQGHTGGGGGGAHEYLIGGNHENTIAVYSSLGSVAGAHAAILTYPIVNPPPACP